MQFLLRATANAHAHAPQHSTTKKQSSRQHSIAQPNHSTTLHRENGQIEELAHSLDIPCHATWLYVYVPVLVLAILSA